MTSKEKGIIEGIIDQAFTAARKATDEYLKKYPDQWFPCGFAWVHFDGRSPVIKVMKEKFPQRRLSKGYPTGIDIWNPSDSGTQCMDAKIAGCDAFVKVINDAGFQCSTGSRWD